MKLERLAGLVILVGVAASGGRAAAQEGAKGTVAPKKGAAVEGPVRQPKEVKVAPLSAVLFESPEMLEECGKAKQGADARREAASQWAKDSEAIRAAYQPATTPVGDMSAEEYAAWKARRKKMNDDLKAVADAYEQAVAGLPRQAEADRVCAASATAALSKGTLLTVLNVRGSMTNVLVKTGRSTGTAGWIQSADTMPSDTNEK
jgi:hypothetical protein